MKRPHKYLGWMLLAPTLLLILASTSAWQQDPEARRSFQELSRQIQARPTQKVFQLTRISNWRRHLQDVVFREPKWNEFRITYDRQRKTLYEGSDGHFETWANVSDDAIHAVARQGGAYRDLARFGCEDIHP